MKVILQSLRLTVRWAAHAGDWITGIGFRNGWLLFSSHILHVFLRQVIEESRFQKVWLFPAGWTQIKRFDKQTMLRGIGSFRCSLPYLIAVLKRVYKYYWKISGNNGWNWYRCCFRSGVGKNKSICCSRFSDSLVPACSFHGTRKKKSGSEEMNSKALLQKCWNFMHILMS